VLVYTSTPRMCLYVAATNPDQQRLKTRRTKGEVDMHVEDWDGRMS
jgi:hypothetical protein